MINRVVLIGRLTADPELRYTKNGTAVATFTLAVERNHKNANGERLTDFIDIRAWKGRAENCVKYLHQGDLFAVSGRIEIDRYQAKDGSLRQSMVVTADEICFIAPLKQSAATPGAAQSTQRGAGAEQTRGAAAPAARQDEGPWQAGAAQSAQRGAGAEQMRGAATPAAAQMKIGQAVTPEPLFDDELPF